MGFSISWFAVRQENANSFFESLNLKRTGKYEKFPKSLISTTISDLGWCILWYNQLDCPFIKDEDLKSTSIGYDILACQVEEHVMFSSAEYWTNGVRKWHVSHEGINGPKGLKVVGQPPDSFDSIKNEMNENQRIEDNGDREVDYIFEIPLETAKSLVGFKHDEDGANIGDKKFYVLSGIDHNGNTEGKKSLLRRLFRL